MARKIVEISIAGTSFKIATEEEESYVLGLVESIEKDLSALYENSSGISTINALALCTLDYIDKYEKAKAGSSNMRNQIKEYLADSASSKLLLDEQRRRCEELQQEVRTLKTRMSGMVMPESEEDAQRKASSIATALKEIEELRQVNDDAVRQCRNLNDRVTALNDFIANQDSELARLKNEIEDKSLLLMNKDQSLADAQAQVKAHQREIAQLRQELELQRSRSMGSERRSYDDDMPNLSWTEQI